MYQILIITTLNGEPATSIAVFENHALAEAAITCLDNRMGSRPLIGTYAVRLYK